MFDKATASSSLQQQTEKLYGKWIAHKDIQQNSIYVKIYRP